MGGWTRLKLVLSVIYWAAAAVFEWTYLQPNSAGGMAIIFPVLALTVYAMGAGLWWAFAGFARR